MKKFYIIEKENGEKDLLPWEGKTPPMMECGHVANASLLLPVNEDDPVQVENSRKGEIKVHTCVICNNHLVDKSSLSGKPPWEGREARCSCGDIVPSDGDLAFFKFRPHSEYDAYYCGHNGWS